MTREKSRATVGRHATNLIELETVGFTISHTVCDSVSVLALKAQSWYLGLAPLSAYC